MDPQDTPPGAPPPPAGAPAPRRGWRAFTAALRGLAWAGHWLPGAVLAMVLGAGVAGWIWAGRDGSLPQALGWAQSWLQDPDGASGQLEASGAQGSLRGGGQVTQLRWTRQGLAVELQGLQLRWSADQLIDALLLRRLQTGELHIDRLRVDDRRPPTPGKPLQAVELPLPIDLAVSVDRLELSGRQTLSVNGLRGHYRYGPVSDADRPGGNETPSVRDAHHLRIDHMALAQGRYSLQAVLGAQAPLPLQASAEGQVSASVPGGNSLTLQATASASGTLAGPDATLDLQARLLPPSPSGTPTLVATARVMPWAPQPLHSVRAQAHALDLALLWPQAPETALSGRVDAAPEDGQWRAHLDLRNTRSGPWDQRRLPLDTLQARITQQGPQWQIDQLQATLGSARVSGQGDYRPARDRQPAQWQGDLQARSLDPARLWSTLAPGALDLEARAEQNARTPDRITLRARAQTQRGAPDGAGLRLRDLQFQGHWSGQARVLQIDEAMLDALQARLQLRGRLEVANSRFSGSSTWALPGVQGQLDGDLAAASGSGQLDVRLDAADRLIDWLHKLRDLPVVGPRLQEALARQALLQEGRLTGQARLQAQWQGGLGALGFPPPGGSPPPPAALQARVDLEVPQLSASLPGGATAAWTVSGLRLQAVGSPSDLALQLNGQALQGRWTAQVQTQGRARGLWPLPAAGGTPAQLQIDTLTLRASDARRTDRVTDWNVASPQPLQLTWQAAATGAVLAAAPGQLQMQPRLRVVAGRAPTPALDAVTVGWDTLVWQAGTLQTRGRLTGWPLAWVDSLGQAEDAPVGPLTRAGLSGDLVFDGDWDLLLPLNSGSEAPRLNAQLQRRSGDLSLLTDSGDTAAPGASGTRRLQAGLREASLSVRTQGRELQARLRWDSERLGQVTADLGSQLSADPGGEGALLDRWWPTSAPLSGTVSARLPQVGVWSALAPPGWRMRGTLQANATVGGTRGTPDWRGTLAADQLALRSVVDGFEFSDGLLRANLSGEQIVIDRFELKGPLGGTLSATGQARWQTVDGQRQPQIDLQLKAQTLRVSNRADRRLTLSGQVGAQLSGQRLNVRGQLKADAALFVLPDESTPTLGSDVVVRGGRNLPQGTSTVAVVQPDVSVDLDLGPQFEVRGRGLQARLTGQLNLRSTPALPAPRVFGVVRTASGSYRAYGQQLSIQTGELSFNGPYDDPTLNILAMRPQARESEQQVGVQIDGTAQGPRVRLVATPDLPDAEKLAWLVLGRPATGAGAEAAILQQAALALLAGNDGALNGGLAGALGLDEIGYRGESVNADGSTRAAAVTLGKRLSNQLYLSYETGLAGAMGTVSVFYDISRRFTLRARAGDENAIDLIFTLQYD